MPITAERLQVDVEANTGRARKELNSFQGHTQKLAGRTKMLVASMAGGLGGAAVAGGIAKSIGMAKDFDLTMRQVGVQTGQTGDGLKDLSALALKMGKDTAFSASDASAAMLDLAKGGLSAADMKAGALASTMTLAAAGGLEMASAADYVTQAMNTFGLAASNTDQIATALAGGANASTASVESLGMALSQVGSGATNAGMSLQETVAALAAFDNQGIKGSDAGTSLKTMLSRLVPQTDAARDSMKKYGLEFVNANGSFKSMSEIAGELQQGLGKLSDAERTAALTTMFGSDASRAATALMKEGTKGVEGYIKATKNQKTVQDMANTAMGGAAGAWEELTGSIETVAIQAGQALLPAFTKMANGAADMVSKLGDSGPQIMAAFDWVKGFVSGFLDPFKPALEPLKGLFDDAASGASALGDVMEPMKGWLADNSELLGRIAGVLTALFIPAMVKAGVAALTLKVQAVAAFIATGAAATKSALMVGVAMVKNIIVMGQVAVAAVATAAQMAAAWAASAARTVASFALMAAGMVAQGARMAATAALTAARVVAGWVLMGTQSLIQAARMAAAWFIALGPVGWAIAAAAAVAVAIYMNWDKIVAFTKAAWGKVKSALVSAWNGIKSATSTALNFVKNLFLNFTGPGLIIKHWDKIKSATVGAFNAVKNAVKNGMNAAKNAIQSAGAAAKNVMVNAWNAIVSAVSGAIGRMMGHVRGVKGKITGAFSGAVGWLSGIGGKIIDGLLSGLRAGFDKVKDTLGALTDMIPSWKGPEKKDKKLLVDAGKKIIGGLVKGLTSSYGDVKKTLGNLTAYIRKAMSGDPEAAMVKRVARTNSRLKGLYARRAKLATRLAAKIERRDNLRQEKDQFRSSVTGGIASQANVLNAGNNAGTIRESLQAQVGKAKEFVKNLNLMKKMGYAKGVVMQVASAGIEQGAEVAKALVAGSKSEVQGISSAFNQINSIADSAGASLAGGYFDAGIQAANGLIQGMKSKEKELAKVTKAVALTLVKAIKKALGIKSPSRVTMSDGENTVLGLVKGVQRKMGLAGRQGALLGSAMATGVTRSIGGMKGLQIGAEAVTTGALSGGTGVGGQVVFHFTTYNPLPEPASQTTNKALDRVVSLGLV